MTTIKKLLTAIIVSSVILLAGCSSQAKSVKITLCDNGCHQLKVTEKQAENWLKAKGAEIQHRIQVENQNKEEKDRL